MDPLVYTGVYRLPASLQADLHEVRRQTALFVAGELPAARFQSFRVPQGVYEQRESGTFMLRVRLAAGILTAPAMRVAAQVAERHGDGTLHLTSRQDLQVHGVRAAAIPDALEALAEGGLSTKGGGGNTVRNIAACYQAGVCPQELFDVEPHVVRLTEQLLPDPLNYQLPRKYKIAFSGCGADCAGATVNDLGLISRVRDGVEGFAVYVGGGMGAISAVARPLEEFVLADEVGAVAEAVKRVFDARGNRKNRHRARIRFLIEDLGWETFVQLYREERERLGCLQAPEFHALPGGDGREVRTTAQAGPGFAEWRRLNVMAQKQAGRFTVEIAPQLGVLTAAELERLAGIVESHGEGVLRATNWQTLLLRHVGEDELAALQLSLAELGLGTGEPAVLRRMVTCAGASTCRLGICLSRPLAAAIREALLAGGLQVAGGTGNVRIHISGCPNACGRHPVAQIALSGAARRVNGRLVPHYQVQFGGHVEEGRTVLATGSVVIPARHVPAYLVAVLREFEAAGAYPDFAAFLAGGGRERAAALAARFTVVDAGDDAALYTDWGAAAVFSLAGRGQAECGAGVFDLIGLDLQAAEDALAGGLKFAATALAARSLLVARGEQAGADRQALDLFRQLFVEQGLVPAECREVVAAAQEAAAAAQPEDVFMGDAAAVADVVAAVKELYASMGPSLRLTK